MMKTTIKILLLLFSVSVSGQLTPANEVSPFSNSADYMHDQFTLLNASDAFVYAAQLLNDAELTTLTTRADTDSARIDDALTQLQDSIFNARTITDHDTLALTDKGKRIYVNATSDKTLTLRVEDSVAYPINTEIYLTNLGEGDLTVIPEIGVDMDSEDGARSLVKIGASATLKKVASDQWILFGDIENKYTETVFIPTYNPGDPEHWLIDSDADFDSINSEVKRVFFAEQGDYTKITINSSGTSTAKRYLVLYRDDDTHPFKLDSAQLADVDIVVDSSNYWVIDRMASFNSAGAAIELTNSSSNILINRCYTKNFAVNGILLEGPPAPSVMENVTIQNCRIGPMTQAGRAGDNVGIFFNGEANDEDRNYLNVKLLNNEIYNCNDGIMTFQIVANNNICSMTNGLIQGNEIWIDTLIYSDGAGNQDSDGLYAFAENAIDIKFGSTDSTMPLVIKENRVWGFRTSDNGGGAYDSWGEAIVAHFGVRYLNILNNTVYNSNRGIANSGLEGASFSVDSVLISGNIIFNIGFKAVGGTEEANYNNTSIRAHFENNIIRALDNTSSKWYVYNNDETNLWVNDNVIINSNQEGGARSGTTTMEDNWYYGTTRINVGDGTFDADQFAANMADTTFVIKRFSLNPEVVTIEDVVTTPSSPHY